MHKILFEKKEEGGDPIAEGMGPKGREGKGGLKIASGVFLRKLWANIFCNDSMSSNQSHDPMQMRNFSEKSFILEKLKHLVIFIYFSLEIVGFEILLICSRIIGISIIQAFKLANHTFLGCFP